jgi:5-methyltetrahydropteroyltriglutamate--homocysteine methyltransferase
MNFRPLSTQIVGSYSKPGWLVRYDEMRLLQQPWWRPDPEVLDEAKDDAVLLALYEQERAGLDIVTDGEQRRQRFDAHFFARLDGIDANTLGVREPWEREGRPARRQPAGGATPQNLAARVVGPVGWSGPIAVDELAFLKRATHRPVKVTLIGPLTTVSRVVDEYYGDERTLGMALAAALNQEARSLAAAGADLIQIDEPAFHSAASRAKLWGADALNRTIEGVTCATAVHMCYGYALNEATRDPSPVYADAVAVAAGSNVDAISIEYEQPGHQPDLLRFAGDKAVILGFLNLGSREIETPEHVARRIRDAMEVVPPERIFPSSDCGMWFLPRSVAYAKISALAEGARNVRSELGV